MSDEDIEYLKNYLPDRLYTIPGPTGAYAKLVGDSGEEVVIGEVEVSPLFRIAVSAFYVKNRQDFGTFKITKLKYSKVKGWREDSHVQLTKFQLSQMKEFLAIISSLDLRDAKKTRIALDDVQIGALGTLLTSAKGATIIRELAKSPELHQDIYAVAAKRTALAEFDQLLKDNTTERQWQVFFECNRWIFGLGLNYVFLNAVGPKLEARTTGNTYNRAGKTIDGFLMTRAAVSQYVLVEIKASRTALLQSDQYRSGCWAVSGELSNAVTQTHKTVFEFTRDNFRTVLKDEDGNDTGEVVYSVRPRSYLVIGNMEQLRGNDDKIACFELYRDHVRAPEILTFDELYYRASCIVENIDREVETADNSAPVEHVAPPEPVRRRVVIDDDEIPF
jgi:hypothetical protein